MGANLMPHARFYNDLNQRPVCSRSQRDIGRAGFLCRSVVYDLHVPAVWSSGSEEKTKGARGLEMSFDHSTIFFIHTALVKLGA